MFNRPLLTLSACLLSLPAFAQPASPGADAVEDDLGVSGELSLRGSHAFGVADSCYWGVTGGVGFALEEDDDSTDPSLGLTYHYFLVDNFEIIGELNAWYFAQDGDDAGGLNPGFTLRWHFLSKDRWSLYADAGIGVLFATDDVPQGGTSVGFMPKAGVGGTFRITDGGTRAYAGVRWHHVSNARFNGDASNPDRDGMMVYGGVMFPLR